MSNQLDTLLAEIATIHSTANIPAEIADQVNAAITTALPAAVTAATASLTQQITDANTAIQAIVDKLATGDLLGAQAVATTAQLPAGSTSAADAPAQ